VLSVKRQSRSLKNDFQKVKLGQIFLQFFILLGVNLILSLILFPILWQSNYNFYQSTIDFLCRIAYLMIFLIVWYNYEMLSTPHHLMGLGSFIIFLLQMLYMAYFQVLIDISHYQLIKFHRFSQAFLQLIVIITILVGTSKNIRIKVNKYTGLATAFFLTLVSFYLVLSPICQWALPKGLIPHFLFFLRLLNLTLLVFLVFYLKELLPESKTAPYNQLLLTVLLISATILCFMLSKDSHSPLLLLAYLLKVSSHYSFFQAIFVSTVTFPHKKLQETRNYMNNLLNNLPLGIMTYTTDSKLKFINHQGEKMLGYKSQELLGLPFEELYTKMTHKKMESSLYYTVLKQGINAKNIISKVITKEGKELQLKVDTYQTCNGEFMHLFTIAAKEQELENLQLQTKAIMDSIESPALLANNEGKIIRCSKAAVSVLETPKEKIIGATLQDLVDFLETEVTNLSSDSTNGWLKSVHYKVRITTNTGKKKELLASYSEILNVEGELIGYFIIGSDVTALQEEQEKIRHQEKLAVLGEMAAGIVHEIKNPLTSIRGFTQLIATTTKEEKVLRYCETIAKEVQDMNKIVSDFLTFAKPQSPNLELTFLNDLLSSLNIMLETHSFMGKVNLTLLLEPKEKPVLADSSQIKQVILNMVKNAIEALEGIPNPQLAIKTSYHSPRKEMLLSIIDNGRGMEETEKRKIGTPFFTTKDRGTGLGLSICFQIVREHGGRVEIKSKISQGTTFNIFLPCQEADSLIPKF